MRTRRSITTAAVLALTLTATTLPAATRDNAQVTKPGERAPIVVKMKRVLDLALRAFHGPTIPIPQPPTP